MKHTRLILLAGFAIGTSFLQAQDHDHSHGDEDVYNVGEINLFTGEGVTPGGFLFPSLYVTGNGSLLEPGASPEDFGTSGHDPTREWGLQLIEFDLGIELGKITGSIDSVFLEDDGDWQGALEEAYLHYKVNDNLSIGGGQFFNTAGWLTGRHSHAWDYVNQSLVATRFYNEGELTTHGGELVFRGDNSDVLKIAFGGVRSHSHSHGHDEEEEHHDEDEDEEHHDDEDHEDEEHHGLEGEEAEITDWVLSADYKFPLLGDETLIGNASIVAGDNGFGEDSVIYGFGIQKIWGAHDHGHGPELCEDGFLFRTEFASRIFDAVDDGEKEEFTDYGLSTRVAYGLTEHSILSFRHDWVSGIEEAELYDTHRFSPAYTTKVGPNKRVQVRLQYDHIQQDELDSEHVGWLQFQWSWGSHSPSHDH